jgi:hypothetical protein
MIEAQTNTQAIFGLESAVQSGAQPGVEINLLASQWERRLGTIQAPFHLGSKGGVKPEIGPLFQLLFKIIHF